MQKRNLVRIAEQNDWVIFALTACIAALSLMLISLQRETSLKEFLLQKIEDSSNIFLTWIIVSVVNVTLISVLFSQFVPFIPAFVKSISVFGLEFNKFGFTFLTVSAFYLVKIIFTYFYFYSVRNQKNWQKFYFSATRFYFITAVILALACLQEFYFSFGRLQNLQLYFAFFAIIFMFKNIYYLFHNYRILPAIWYYKILYICTLQIIPVLVLWKVIFH